VCGDGLLRALRVGVVSDQASGADKPPGRISDRRPDHGGATLADLS
jgi:hypothetical protein